MQFGIKVLPHPPYSLDQSSTDQYFFQVWMPRQSSKWEPMHTRTKMLSSSFSTSISLDFIMMKKKKNHCQIVCSIVLILMVFILNCLCRVINFEHLWFNASHLLRVQAIKKGKRDLVFILIQNIYVTILFLCQINRVIQ